jgi:phosphocarrier protein
VKLTKITPAAVVCSKFALTKRALSGIIYYMNRGKKTPTTHNRDCENVLLTNRDWRDRIMLQNTVVVQNQVGLHARPATFFIQKANEFKSSIWIEKEDRRVNAKSLLGILSLGIVGGTTIKIIADGADEEEAVKGLVDLVDSGFAEEAR